MPVKSHLNGKLSQFRFFFLVICLGMVGYTALTMNHQPVWSIVIRLQTPAIPKT